MAVSVRPLLLLGALALALGSCYSQGAGVDPPLDRIYFPVAMTLSPGATRLYLVNSDFDLQYNAGSLQVFDLERLRALIPKACAVDSDCPANKRCDSVANADNAEEPSFWCVDKDGAWAGKPCGAFGEQSPPHRLLIPGRCGWVHPTRPQNGSPSLIIAHAGIGAFATDVVYRRRPNGPGGRLFIPVRGDATLHYADVIDDTETPGVPFELECGQADNGGNCDDAHRRGDQPDQENTRGIRLPPEPYFVDATEDGEAVVVTHQTQGAASLFVNDAEAWGDGTVNYGVGPKLEFVVGGMPSRPIGVAALPVPAYVAAFNATAKPEDQIHYAPGFLVTFRDASEIDLLRYYADQASPSRPFIQVGSTIRITANSLGFDSRGIAVDPSERKACEANCSGQVDCLHECAALPLKVYVANRSPSSLLVGETRPSQSPTASDDLPHFTDTVPLPFGPSRVVVGKVIDLNGEVKTRIFVVCFDSRELIIYDPKSRNLTEVTTGRGPHALATDLVKDATGKPTAAYAYVGHFTDSYLGVVDLDERHATFGTMVLAVGRPSPPRASK